MCSPLLSNGDYFLERVISYTIPMTNCDYVRSLHCLDFACILILQPNECRVNTLPLCYSASHCCMIYHLKITGCYICTPWTGPKETTNTWEMLKEISILIMITDKVRVYLSSSHFTLRVINPMMHRLFLKMAHCIICTRDPTKFNMFFSF